MSDELLLTDEELAGAQAEAERILAEPVKQYEYRTDYKGGPRNVEEQQLVASAIELTTARIMIEELEDRMLAAKLQRCELIEEHLDAGLPVDHVAEHSGLKHRASVYRELRRLPKLREKMNQIEIIRNAMQLRRG